MLYIKAIENTPLLLLLTRFLGSNLCHELFILTDEYYFIIKIPPTEYVHRN